MITKFNIKKTKRLKLVNSVLKIIYRKPCIRQYKNICEYKEILIVDFSLIGDMVMNIPFLNQIRQNCPKATVTMVVRRQSVNVLKKQELVDRFIVFDGKEYLATPYSIFKNKRRIKNIINQINEKKYDLAIEPKGDLRHIWFMHHIKADRSISYNYTGGDFLVTNSYTPRAETKHLIDEKLDLLEMAGFTVDRNNSTPQFRGYIHKSNNEKTIIGIHPGASCKNKMYRHFGAIIDYIAGMNRNIQFYVFNDPVDENKLAEGVIERIEKNSIEYRLIEESLDKYIEMVSECNLMICNDSSAGHIAAAYGIPVIVIFGAIKSETACPRGSKVRCISYECECKPCTLDDCPKGTYDCLEKIDINEVYNALEEMIE